MKVYKNKNEKLVLETVIIERSNGTKEVRPSILITIGNDSYNLSDGLALMEQLAKFSRNLNIASPVPEYRPFTFQNLVSLNSDNENADSIPVSGAI